MLLHGHAHGVELYVWIGVIGALWFTIPVVWFRNRRLDSRAQRIFTYPANQFLHVIEESITETQDGIPLGILLCIDCGERIVTTYE